MNYYCLYCTELLYTIVNDVHDRKTGRGDNNYCIVHGEVVSLVSTISLKLAVPTLYVLLPLHGQLLHELAMEMTFTIVRSSVET